MKSMKKICDETVEKHGCTKSQLDLFISALRNEVIGEIKDLRKRVVTYIDNNDRIILAYIPEEDRACINMLKKIFEIREYEIKKHKSGD